METKNFVYEAPQVEIMEIEIEQAVLMNASGSGNDMDPTEREW